ncbi:MAG: carbohydrate kinase, partial [Oscillospiraceae bacterium]|nr:carbohydrate kinase [Oscillospiraceae bacterium]
ETGTLGCAILAAAGTGAYPDLTAAARAMSPVGERFEPDPEAGRRYEKRYTLYKRLMDCLDPLWGDMQKVIEEQ